MLVAYEGGSGGLAYSVDVAVAVLAPLHHVAHAAAAVGAVIDEAAVPEDMHVPDACLTRVRVRDASMPSMA